jgi:glycerophosphoryl diester phosphodiesterase
MAGKTKMPLVQLVDSAGQPYDFALAGDRRTFADLVSPEGLSQVATYAQAIGVDKSLLLRRDPSGRVTSATTVVREAHRLGLLVHAWTFRAENRFLPPTLRIGKDANRLGNLREEVVQFLREGIDGFFTDHPGLGRAARDEFSTTH